MAPRPTTLGVLFVSAFLIAAVSAEGQTPASTRTAAVVTGRIIW